MNNKEILDILCALVAMFEGCFLRAYPDPASPLYKALSQRKILRAYMKGLKEIPPDLKGLSGAPWTCGYGETEGVVEGMVWTQEYAIKRLRASLAKYLLATYKKCPQLYLEPPGRIIGCTSLAYNIGLGAFGASSVCRKTKYREFEAAARAFLLWNKARGQVMAGLTKRRTLESKTYLGELQYKGLPALQ